MHACVARFFTGAVCELVPVPTAKEVTTVYVPTWPQQRWAGRSDDHHPAEGVEEEEMAYG